MILLFGHKHSLTRTLVVVSVMLVVATTRTVAQTCLSEIKYSFQADTCLSNNCVAKINFQTDSYTGAEEALYCWNFGDGESLCSSDTFTSHTYNEQGLRKVFLSVMGDDNLICNYDVDIPIFTSDDSCMIDYDGIGNSAGYLLRLESSNTNVPDQAIYDWDFGDGESINATTQNSISHLYRANGIYTVCSRAYINDIVYCQECVDINITELADLTQVEGRLNKNTKGTLILYTLNDESEWRAIKSLDMTDSQFMLDSIFLGRYIIKAIPEEGSNYIPTYYPNKLNWEQAHIFDLNFPTTDIDLTFATKYKFPLSGNGIISGQFELTSFTNQVITESQPIILLKSPNSNKVIDWQRLTNDQTFVFDSLLIGSYLLHIETIGFKDLYFPITLTRNEERKENLFLEISDTVSLASVRQQRKIVVSHSNQRLAFSYDNYSSIDNLNLYIYDANGRQYTGATDMDTDQKSVSIDISILKQGLYFCKVKLTKSSTPFIFKFFKT